MHSRKVISGPDLTVEETKQKVYVRSVSRDLFILSCVFLDASLVAALFFSYYSFKIFYLISAPLGFLIVAGSIMIATRIERKRRRNPHFEFNLFGWLRFRSKMSEVEREKKKKAKDETSLVEGGGYGFVGIPEKELAKKVKSNELMGGEIFEGPAKSGDAVGVKYLVHTCPVHGLEKCAGAYLHTHSCNQDTGKEKQITWEEVPKYVKGKKESGIT